MKPHRLRMTHSLLLAYGMYKRMEVYRPHPASQQELERFHASDYIEFLKRVTADNQKEYLHQLQKCQQTCAHASLCSLDATHSHIADEVLTTIERAMR